MASILATLLAFGFSLGVSIGLGFLSYMLTQPEGLGSAIQRSAVRDVPEGASTELIFFSIFGLLYLMWATVPLSLGGSKQFDAGKMLIYPITLRKLFAVDFLSEFSTLHSLFLIPAVIAMAIGAGLGSGHLATTLIGAAPPILFGATLAKFLSTTIGSVVRRKPGRGETIIAMIGAVAGLGGAAAGQLAPTFIKHADSLRYFRWTPPGAATVLLTTSVTEDPLAYGVAFVTLSAYAVILIVATYWMARRAALGLERREKRKAAVAVERATYTGWQIPFLPSDLSAIVEKELRYALRNAQVRMMALMPLIVIVIRFVNGRRFSPARGGLSDSFATYGSSLLLIGGVLYVFLILSGISCNLFAFEEGGMRTIVLSPIDRRKILLGKNFVVNTIALSFALALLVLNVVIFADVTVANLIFLGLSFVIFAALNSSVGNWVSIRFPKRMRYGKRMNLSGVAGLLVIPLVAIMIAPPVLATLAGYLTRSILNEYLVLLLFTVLSLGIYWVAINWQGKMLARRELDILDVVREPTDE